MLVSSVTIIRFVVFRQFGECLALVRVCGEPANEGAIVSIVFQLLEPFQKVFHGAALNGPLALATDRSNVFARMR